MLCGKQEMEKVQTHASALVDDFEEDSRTRILTWASDHERRYMRLCEETAERKERCEEATAALQTYMEPINKFDEWLEKMEKMLEERKKEKQPISTLQTVLEEHYVSRHGNTCFHGDTGYHGSCCFPYYHSSILP